MTYIELVNRFWIVDEAAGFSGVETKLYFKLLDITNKLHWKKKKLALPMIKLMGVLKASKNTVINARNRLAECGLIEFESGIGKKRAAIYTIVGVDRSMKEVMESEVFRDEMTDMDDDFLEEIVEADSDESEISEKTERIAERICEPNSERKTERIGEPNPDPYIRREEDEDEKEDEDGMIIINTHDDFFCEEIVSTFNRVCFCLDKVKKLSHDTRENLIQRRKHFKSPGDWEAYFDRVARCDFLNGKNKYGWKADLNWLVKDDITVNSVLNGKYERKQGVGTQAFDPVRGNDAHGGNVFNDNLLSARMGEGGV